MARGPLAGASGPGKFSKRTDMSLGSTSYGEGGETAALNTAAPKSKTRGVADDVGGRPANPVSQAPVTDFTIGIDSVEKMIAKMKENPWPIYKIKVCFD